MLQLDNHKHNIFYKIPVLRWRFPKFSFKFSADIDECANSPCLNGGTCADQVNGYVCSCQAEYAGLHCQKGESSTQIQATLRIKFIDAWLWINVFGIFTCTQTKTGETCLNYILLLVALKSCKEVYDEDKRDFLKLMSLFFNLLFFLYSSQLTFFYLSFL